MSEVIEDWYSPLKMNLFLLGICCAAVFVESYNSLNAILSTVIWGIPASVILSASVLPKGSMVEKKIRPFFLLMVPPLSILFPTWLKGAKSKTPSENGWLFWLILSMSISVTICLSSIPSKGIIGNSTEVSGLLYNTSILNPSWSTW